MLRLTRAQVRDVDRIALAEFGLPGIVLMENAGRGAAELLMSLGIDGPVVVVAGKGNNGGDGLVIARHLDARGYPVRIALCAEPGSLTGDAAVNYHVVERAGLPIMRCDGADSSAGLQRELSDASWVVDALLGTGASGAPRGPVASAIEQINAVGRPVLSVDIPSGLDCDTGIAAQPCVRARHTTTFVARKVGFDQPGAAAYIGTVHVLGIGIPRCLLNRFTTS